MIENKQLKALAAYTERVQGLIADRYLIMFSHEDETMIFVKMVHRNGNRVAVFLNKENGELRQYTNGKIVFSD